MTSYDIIEPPFWTHQNLLRFLSQEKIWNICLRSIRKKNADLNTQKTFVKKTKNPNARRHEFKQKCLENVFAMATHPLVY